MVEDPHDDIQIKAAAEQPWLYLLGAQPHGLRATKIRGAGAMASGYEVAEQEAFEPDDPNRAKLESYFEKQRLSQVLGTEIHGSFNKPGKENSRMIKVIYMTHTICDKAVTQRDNLSQAITELYKLSI